MLTLETFGKRLIAARHAKELTQEALAEALGTSPKMIFRLERGDATARVPLGALQRLRPVLGVSLDWLIGQGEEATGSHKTPVEAWGHESD